MEPFASFSLVTPLFGFALALPAAAPPADLIVAVRAAQEADGSGESEEDLGDEDDAELDALDAELDAALGEEDDAAYTADVRERARLAQTHRAFGIATWAAMGLTVGLGVIQYYNLYGGDRDGNPCVRGDALFGQGQCSGTPWPHLLAALGTTALYTTTFVLSVLMPDPDRASEGDTDFARRLRQHKVLRWVHLVGMAAQLGLGVVIANGDSFGLDRANDYDTLQALSITHLAIGLVTWGAMTWAGISMGMFQ